MDDYEKNYDQGLTDNGAETGDNENVKPEESTVYQDQGSKAASSENENTGEYHYDQKQYQSRYGGDQYQYQGAQYTNPQYTRPGGYSHSGEYYRYDRDQSGRQPYSSYQQPYQGGYSYPPKNFKQKKQGGGKKAVIVVASVIAALALLFGGALIGSSIYGHYYTNNTALPGDNSHIAENSGSENAQSGNDVTLNIADTPEEKYVAPSADGALSVAQIAQKMTPSVVGIVSENLTNPMYSGSGSGIVLTEDGYVITNCHVIQNGNKITVVLDNGDSYDARVIGSDEQTDLAVLKIDASGLVAAELGDSDKLVVGDLAVAIGNPMGMELQGSVTSGVISGVNRDITIGNRTMTLIQTDAAINPGNSGGPLVNKYGQVIGMNTVKISVEGYDNLGFAIPMSTIKPIVEELIKNGYVSGRPALGIVGGGISERYANYYNWPRGIYVESVNDKSDAKVQGLRSGDIITAINGVEVKTISDLDEIKKDMKAGDVVTATVYRNGQTLEIKFALMDAADAD